MLAAISAQVNTDLRGFAGLTALLTKGVDGVRPLIAEANDGDAFIVYYVRFDGTFTKGSAGQYQLIVQSWAKTYDESIAIADQVENAIGASSTYYTYVSAIPKYSDQDIIYTEQIFEIKK